MEGLERKLRNTIEISFEKIVERLQRQNESEEAGRLRNIKALVKRKGKEGEGIEKRILSQTAPPEVTGLPNTIGEQNREEVTREVALLENREVQVVEREETETQRILAVPLP